MHKRLYHKVYELTQFSKSNIRGFSNFCNASILGIETSCDDTGCAIISGSGELLGESLHSQNSVHIKYGGINPVIARDLHRENIETVVNESLQQSKLKLSDIHAIAVTTKPGLLASLNIGVKYAKYIAKKYNKPLIPIHHMEAHALVVRMYQNIPFPFIVLLISGGHCLLAVVKDINSFLLLGESLDNAPGEILDKAARRMKLKNIPDFSKMAGGKAIEIAASKSNNPKLFNFPLPLARNRDCNFSFSGLKNSLFQSLAKKESEHKIMADSVIPEVNDLCAAFQLAIAEHIVHRTERAILFSELKGLINKDNKNIIVSGGVACNNFIFKSVNVIGKKYGYNVYRPPPKLCTDNGVMIAWNGVEKYRKKCDIMFDIPFSYIDPIAPLGKNIINNVKSANISVRVTRLKEV